jgi:SAM-dependent methyltransferase
MFIDTLARQVEREQPQVVGELSEAVVTKRLRVGVKRAIARGARSEAAVRRFVALMFSLEPEFDQRYRVQQLFSSRSGTFDEVVLTMHEWSHPNCWYRPERSFTEERWQVLTCNDESHTSPLYLAPGPKSDAEWPRQLSPEYGFQLDVPHVGTPEHIVRSMLELARVGPSDTVMDLGSGDGRMVIAAAALFGARAVGVDLNPEQVSTARTAAERAGVSQLVSFRRGDLFDADLSGVTVVTLYLLRDVNLALRDKLQGELPRGGRVVSWQYDMGEWQPNIQVGEQGNRIYSWLIG